MKTRCPDCQTVFRVTPEQLKARAGQVRCGHCQAVFNALDSLLEERHPAGAADAHVEPAPAPQAEPEIVEAAKSEAPLPSDDAPPVPAETPEADPAAGLILPRETTEIPGYSKWSEGVIAAPVSLPSEKPTRWPFVLVALLLVLALAGQVVFHFRSEIATALPSLRPWLASASQALGRDLPLPRHVELISIEVSDLQNDPAHGNLLVLNATLRNRAAYGQAYPSLELALTDTQDAAVARRVFSPAEYLSAKTPADQPFAANSDLAVKLWIEAKDIAAAGYRLYVFYP